MFLYIYSMSNAATQIEVPTFLMKCPVCMCVTLEKYCENARI